MFRGVINKKILTFPASKFLDVDASKILLLRGFAGRNLSKQQNEENKVKVLFDGKCPICVHEIRLLKRKDRKKQNVVWVDISQDQYQAADLANIDYVTAMGAMHVIDKNGTVYNNIDAFPVMYNAVGLGWIWSFLKLPGMYNLSQKAYSWFAKNRLSLSGRKDELCSDGRCDTKRAKKTVNGEV